MSNPLWTPNIELVRGCVAYWELDEGSGNRADATGNGHTLSASGSPVSGVGFIGNAAKFVSASTQFLFILSGSATAFEPGNNSFSIRARVNLDTVAVSKGIFGKFLTTGNQRGWDLAFSTTSNRFRLILSPDGTNGTVLDYSAVTPVSGTWYDICAGWNAGAGQAWLTVDAGPIATVAYTGGIFANISNLAVGAQNGGAATRCDGRIDTLGYWNRKLTWEEIRHLHQSRTYPFV